MKCVDCKFNGKTRSKVFIGRCLKFLSRYSLDRLDGQVFLSVELPICSEKEISF